MAKGRIVIIEHDDWEAALLRKFLTEAGYEVHVVGEARAGFDKVRELLPDCILCSVDLPDIDGFWVARRVRAEPSKLSTIPFLFLVEAEDIDSRLQGLNVGGDVCLSKPFRAEEVVAQVRAMIEMVGRFRAHQSPSERPLTAGFGVAFHGDLSQVSVSTVLTLLELERRTGKLKVTSDTGRSALLTLIQGALLLATLDDQAYPPTDLLRELLRWKRGNFSFRGETVAASSQDLPKIGGILLEALRLEDEKPR